MTVTFPRVDSQGLQVRGVQLEAQREARQVEGGPRGGVACGAGGGGGGQGEREPAARARSQPVGVDAGAGGGSKPDARDLCDGQPRAGRDPAAAAGAADAAGGDGV